MNLKLVWNDFKRNKVITITIVLFIAIASMLLSLTSILSINLFGSIDNLMEKAKTPHFMQMHNGEINTSEIENFAKSNSKVKEYQIVNFLGIESGTILVNGSPIGENIQDNGFVLQSEKFDFLPDVNGNIVYPLEGETYAPLFYNKSGIINMGDVISIEGVNLKVVGFNLDSQMSSALASSKRFLINERDYNKLLPFGKLEHLIEFRLNNLDDLNKFQTDYSSANLPSNGPAITWPLFRMVNALSDGIMIAVILLVSILTVLISMLCIRFTLLSKVEEDYREIGVLKAIGVRLSDIKRIYLNNYGFLSIIGILLGFGISMVLYNPLLRRIKENFGESQNVSLAFIVAIILEIILFGIIMLFVLGNLRSFKNLSAIQALRFGISNNSKEKTFNLRKNKIFPLNFFMGFSDVMKNLDLYFTLLVVVLLSTFIIILPQNLHNTMSSTSFLSYMGVGKCDIRMDIQQSNNINEETEKIIEYIKNDDTVDKYALLETKTFSVKYDNSSLENLKVELGDFKIFPIKAILGDMPKTDNEIALSSLIADEWNKKLGDSLVLVTDYGEKNMIVSGIYSDVTNGGKTAKAIFKDDKARTSWNVICISFKDGTTINIKQKEYSEKFGFARVSDVEGYIGQIFGQTLEAIKSASNVSIIISMSIVFLVTTLFLKLLIVKNRYDIAVIKAMGFTNRDLKIQFAARILTVIILGIILGTVLVGTLGEKIVAGAMSSFGATGFKLINNNLFTFIVSPILLIVTSIIATIILTKRIGNINISQLLKE